MESFMTLDEKFLLRHFGKILFLLNFAAGFMVWYQGSRLGLFAPPRPGMDQHTILEAARGIASGVLPMPGKYLYSPSYTLFLGFLAKITGNSLPAMRILQLALSSLVPWMIYRTGIYSGFGRKASAIAGIFWLFCGSALLISLDFLRAAPLALCFITLVYFSVRSLRCRCSLKYPVWAGVFAGLCMLGRENFIPVVAIPFLFRLFPFRDFADKKRYLILYICSAILLMLPVLAYNFYHTSSIAILPGNGKNVFEFMQGKGSLSTPLQTFQVLIGKIPQTAWGIITPFENTNSLSVYAHREAILLLKVLCLPVTLLYALVFAAAYRRNRSIYLILLLIAGYAASLFFCEIYYRFRIPVLPLLCLAGGVGVMQISALWQKKEKKVLLFLLPVLLAGVLIYQTVPEKLIPRSEREATVRFLLDRRKFDQAGDLLLKYRKLGVPSPAGERFLIALLLKFNRQQEAEFWYGRFISAAPASMPDEKAN